MRRKFDAIVLEWQEKLLEHVSNTTMKRASQYFQPYHYEEVITERNLANLCGYPTCSNVKQQAQGKFRISLAKRKVYDTSQVSKFCSHTCFAKSRFYAAQLSTEPVYMRSMETWPWQDILLLDEAEEKGIISTSKQPEKLEHVVEKTAKPGNETDMAKFYVHSLISSLPSAPEELSLAVRENIATKLPEPPRIGDMPSEVPVAEEAQELDEDEIDIFALRLEALKLAEANNNR